VMFDMDKFDPEDVKPRVDEVREIKARIEHLQNEVKQIKAGHHPTDEPTDPHASPDSHEPPEP